MKICILSDTHMPKKAKQLPKSLLTQLQKADLIIHAGDWQTIDVYKELTKYAHVEGVVGNLDNAEIKKLFPSKKVLQIQSFKIGIVHGHEGKGGTTERRAFNAFADEDIDMIIFGHSHIPLKKQLGETLVFNPGSPTDKRRQPDFSFGIAHVGANLDVKHIFFSEHTK